MNHVSVSQVIIVQHADEQTRGTIKRHTGSRSEVTAAHTTQTYLRGSVDFRTSGAGVDPTEAFSSVRISSGPFVSVVAL